MIDPDKRSSGKNYEAWRIDQNDFPEGGEEIDILLFFCRYAILSASGHNSQPWKISPGEKTILVKINKDHYISGEKSGLLNVEPYVSIGTFLETLTMAASGYGYDLVMKYSNNPDEVASVELGKGQRANGNKEILGAITHRVSNRSNFAREPLSKSSILTLGAVDIKGVNLTVVEDNEHILKLARLTESAIKNIMKHKKYRQELAEWVRNNVSKKFDGMPGFTHGVPTIPSFVAKIVIRNSARMGPPPSRSKELMINSGALLIVGYQKAERTNFIDLGRAYSRICINAQLLGLATSALGAAVIDAESRERVVKEFGLNYRPAFIIRVGKPTETAAHSPRWPLSKLID